MSSTAPGTTSAPETRFERRLAKILEHATAIFCEKGYEGASMRDLSRSSGMSLAGLYYYFESKEKLLYLIQKHYFTTVMTVLREQLEDVVGAEEGLRTFIVNHLEYFLSSPAAMKVLSHEDDVLEDELGTEIRAIKRILPQLHRPGGRAQERTISGVQYPDRGSQPVWNDELAAHLVQPARGRRPPCVGAPHR